MKTFILRIEFHIVYDYLLLQAGAFGSKWIGIEGNKWTNNTFRSYWLPTETSNRKSPVNPMMPLPNTLYERVFNIVDICFIFQVYVGEIDHILSRSHILLHLTIAERFAGFGKVC